MASAPPDNRGADMQVDPASPTFAAERGPCKGLMPPLMRKRARSPMHLKVQELQRGGEDPDLEIRSQKRYLTEMIAVDLSKLRMDQQHANASAASRSRPPFTLPSIRLPPSPRPTPAAQPLGSGKLTDFMDCDDCTASGSSADFIITAYVPPAPLTNCTATTATTITGSQPCPSASAGPSTQHTSAEPAAGRAMSCPSLQQLQREAHDSPSSPTDNKLSVDLRKAALIRSLLHKSYDPASRSPLPLPPPPLQVDQQQQQCSTSHGTAAAAGAPADSHALVAAAAAAAAAAPLPAAAAPAGTSTVPAPAPPVVAMDVSPEAPAVGTAAAQEPTAASTLQLTPPGARLQPPYDGAAHRARAVLSEL